MWYNSNAWFSLIVVYKHKGNWFIPPLLHGAFLYNSFLWQKIPIMLVVAVSFYEMSRQFHQECQSICLLGSSIASQNRHMFVLLFGTRAYCNSSSDPRSFHHANNNKKPGMFYQKYLPEVPTSRMHGPSQQYRYYCNLLNLYEVNKKDTIDISVLFNSLFWIKFYWCCIVVINMFCSCY